MDTDFELKPSGFHDRVLEEFPPFWTRETHWAGRDILVHIHQKHTPNPDALEGFQILGDAFPRNVAVHPKPINPWTGRIRRSEKTCFQWI
jgi:hypothetical protein